MDLSRLDWNFKLFGFPIRVMVSFWLICVLFSPFTKGIEGPWLFGLLGWSAAVLGVFLIHELGHALAMRKFYGADPSIDLGVGHTKSGAFVFGGLTSCRAYNTTLGNRAIVAAAGPCAEIAAVAILVLAAALCGVRFEIGVDSGFIPYVAPDPGWFKALGAPAAIYCAYFFVDGFIWIGLVWGLFNILPIYPCDGGHLLLCLLSKAYGPAGVRATLIVSILCAVLFAILFLAARSVFMPIFLGFSAYQNYQLLKYNQFR